MICDKYSAKGKILTNSQKKLAEENLMNPAFYKKPAQKSAQTID